MVRIQSNSIKFIKTRRLIVKEIFIISIRLSLIYLIKIFGSFKDRKVGINMHILASISMWHTIKTNLKKFFVHILFPRAGNQKFCMGGNLALNSDWFTSFYCHIAHRLYVQLVGVKFQCNKGGLFDGLFSLFF